MVKSLDEQIKSLQERQAQLKARENDLVARRRERERKARTKRLTAIHGWSAVLLGLLLYAVVLTGTAAVFAHEIGAWSAGHVTTQSAFEKPIDATVRREDLVKFDHLPLIQRVPSVTAAKPGQRVRLRIEAIDLLTLGLSCRYVETLGEALVAIDALEDESDLEFIPPEATSDVAETDASTESLEAGATDIPAA